VEIQASKISGDSGQETLQPEPEVTDFGAWFSALTGQYPAAYAKIDEYLKQVMSDLKDIQNPVIGKDSKSLVIQFSYNQASLRLPFKYLSDGEKCFMICALALAANNAYGPLLCFWDEPDNFLALDEVRHFVLALRTTFQTGGGQFIATSHNSEAISSFSKENILLLQRKNHFEPTVVRPLSEVQFQGDLIGALIRGDL
jgi:ABC-type multidrug transport system ATPase subunit